MSKMCGVSGMRSSNERQAGIGPPGKPVSKGRKCQGPANMLQLSFS